MTRRRRRPNLLDLELDGIMHHAIDSYLTRKPGVKAPGARLELLRLAKEAVYVHRTPTGMEIHRAGGMRFVVHRPARRAPILLTVIAEDA